jgi:hypothetical protein
LFSLKPAIFPTLFLLAAMLACGGGGSGTTTAVSSASSGGSWQKVSLPSGATQVNYIAFNSSDHWFIADRSHGFYRSTDQGATWTQINSGMATTIGWTINVNPANGDLIASIVSGSVLNAHPVNFYRSSDEGNSWTLIPSVHLSSITALTGCVFAPNTNLVCGGYWSPFPNSGAWVSTNGGLTTTAATTFPNNGGGVFGLGANPIAGDLWLGTEQMGIFRSTDDGFTWKEASPPDLQIDPVHGIRDGNIYAITFDRSGNVLFGSQGGIWKSSKTSAGYTWTNVLKNQDTSAGKALARDANGNLYYGHNQDKLNPIVVYRSTDDGNTWSAYNAGIPSSLQGRQFAVNPADGRLYVVITDETSGSGWLYRTVNAVQ